MSFRQGPVTLAITLAFGVLLYAIRGGHAVYLGLRSVGLIPPPVDPLI